MNDNVDTLTLVADILREVQAAEHKFPAWPTDPIHAAAIVAEESGELVRAATQRCYEPAKSTRGDVREEAIQTAAMCVRFLRSMDRYLFEAGSQHRQVGGEHNE